MITPKQWEAFTPLRRSELIVEHVFVPGNRYKIPSGYYTDAEMAQLIRERNERGTQGQVKFLVDML